MFQMDDIVAGLDIREENLRRHATLFMGAMARLGLAPAEKFGVGVEMENGGFWILAGALRARFWISFDSITS